MNTPKLRGILCALICMANAMAIAQVNGETSIFYNGKIFTANPSALHAEAVAFKDENIIAVGNLSVVQQKAGKNAKMIDLKGNTLLPGIVDSHNHAASGGRTLLTAHVRDYFLDADSLAAYAQYAVSSKRGLRGDVLFIQGFHSNTWKDLNILQKIFDSPPYADRAVALKGSDGHTSWVNRNMLKRAGITAAFIKTLPADEQAYFGSTTTGEPNGLIAESAFAYIEKIMPASPFKLSDGLAEGVKHLNALGITAWMDPSAGSVAEGMSNTTLVAYRDVSSSHKLSAHVTAVIKADGNATPGPQIETARKWKAQFASNKNVSVAGFKIFADGVMEFPTQTASMSMPYNNSGLKGSRMVDPENFKQFVVAADREKLLVHVHAIGDLAVTDALNAIESARMANKNNTIPHSITHLQCINPIDIARFGKANVPVCLQLLWATADIYTDELVKPYVSEIAYANMYPARSIVQSGGLVCGASDWPVSSANPFEAIYMAETRRGKFGVLNEKEIMKRIDMLNAYTINAAKAILLEKSIGSIEVGKQADFVLLDRDVLSVSSEQVKDTQVLWTMFRGDYVYKK